jgi:hypothetical protein
MLFAVIISSWKSKKQKVNLTLASSDQSVVLINTGLVFIIEQIGENMSKIMNDRLFLLNLCLSYFISDN